MEKAQNASLGERGIDETLTQEMRGLNVSAQRGDSQVLLCRENRPAPVTVTMINHLVTPCYENDGIWGDSVASSTTIVDLWIYSAQTQNFSLSANLDEVNVA